MGIAHLRYSVPCGHRLNYNTRRSVHHAVTLWSNHSKSIEFRRDGYYALCGMIALLLAARQLLSALARC